MKKNIFNTILGVLFIILIFIPNDKKQEIENTGVELGAGFDVEEIFKNDYIYEITRVVELFGGENKRFTENYIGSGRSIGETRENRSDKSEKSILQGMEKVYVIGEEQARIGIKNALDVVSKNPYVNDTGEFAVCEGHAKDFLEHKIKGHDNIIQYVEGLIKNTDADNFVVDNFSVVDILVRVNGEGRSAIIPYLKMDSKGVYIWGYAIFSGDKMVKKIKIEDAKIMNLLRQNKGKGVITIQKDKDHYLDVLANSNQKVKCYKKDGKYIFDIDIKLKGQILTNELYKKLYKDPDTVKEVEGDLAAEIEKQCNRFIAMMKKDIKVDCLDLGKYAVAKYGRRSGTNWNEAVMNSQINVKANIEIVNLGRGDY